MPHMTRNTLHLPLSKNLQHRERTLQSSRRTLSKMGGNDLAAKSGHARIRRSMQLDRHLVMSSPSE
eukprot:206662-Pleurochrysis_carterae.AAC.2